MIKQKKKDYKLALTALVFLLIYISIMIGMSLIPGDNLKDSIIPKYSIVLHFLEFLGLAFVSTIVFALFDIEYFFSSITGLILFMSILTEGLQYFVPGRFFSVVDLVVNIAGGFTLLLIIILSNILFMRKEGPL